MVGIVTGALLGVLISDEDKKRIQKILHKRVAGLSKAYTYLIKEGAAKVKSFVKKRLEY